MQTLREIKKILATCFPHGEFVTPDIPEKDFLPEEFILGTGSNRILFLQSPETPEYVVFWATPIGIRDYCIIETQDDIIGWASVVWAEIAKQQEDVFLDWLNPQKDKEITPELKGAYATLVALGVEFPGHLIERLTPRLKLKLTHLLTNEGKHYFQVPGTEFLALEAMERSSDPELGSYLLACNCSIGIPGHPRITRQGTPIIVKGDTEADGRNALTAFYITLVWTEYLARPKESE